MHQTNLAEEINKTKSKNFFVIVEGKNDLHALVELGFNPKNIFVLKNGKNIQEDIEFIINELKKRKQECVILTDLDSEGKKLYNIIKNELSKEGIKINNFLRKQLLKEKISHIEGLATFTLK
ncbi:MAG: toprim domain-containing protein [Candidatus Pacearchaeota archaeon]